MNEYKIFFLCLFLIIFHLFSVHESHEWFSVIMIGDPVLVVLKYLASVEIFVIRIKRMDEYLLFTHFLCSLISINKSARLLVLTTFIILHENTGLLQCHEMGRTTELSAPTILEQSRTVQVWVILVVEKDVSRNAGQNF